MKNTWRLKPVCVGGDQWLDIIMLLKGKEMTYMMSPSSRHIVAMVVLENSPSKVSANKSQSVQWHSALANHTWHKTIACIVVDETHILLIANVTIHHNWLQHFYHICSEPVPLILLNAILPPFFLPTLKETYDTACFQCQHLQARHN